MQTTITFKHRDVESWAKGKEYKDLETSDFLNFIQEKIVKHFNIKKKSSINKISNELNRGVGFFSHVKGHYIEDIYYQKLEECYYIEIYDTIKELS